MAYGLKINGEMQSATFDENERALAQAKKAAQAHCDNGAWKAEVTLHGNTVWVAYNKAALAEHINASPVDTTRLR